MPDYTRCRTIGHAWFDADSDWKSDLGIPVTLRCERCSMERREVWARSTGRLMYRRYHQPPDYRYGVNETPSREDFRMAMIALRLREARAARQAGNGGASLRSVK
jgi:hypothetical protein